MEGWEFCDFSALKILIIFEGRKKNNANMEKLEISEGSKEQKYEMLLKQIKNLVECESDPIARMANVTAMIQETFDFFWTGFYRVIGEQLVLGPFQGSLACMRIPYGKGVCGKAWESGETIVVEDVNSFPGHIACSSLSKSEIVVPVFEGEKVVAVLDIDSDEYATFDDTDKKYLQKISKLLD